jgi:hypothetical protein
LHVDQDVQSNNALSLMLTRFDDYKSMFRPGASKHFIVVTDDDSNLDAVSFDTQIKAKLAGNDPLFIDYFFHSIYGYGTGTCSTASWAAAIHAARDGHVHCGCRRRTSSSWR